MADSENAAAVGLVDTHCHLSDKRFEEDRDEAVARARAAGVTHIVAVGGGGPVEASEFSADLARAYPFIRATAGIHPHDAASFDAATERRVESLLARDEVVAVGETGLDYYYDHSPREVQKDALARHIALARKTGLPIVLHCRDAESDLRDVLTSEWPGPARGVVHCFTGKWDDARWYLDKGLAVSFTGIITFKNADALRDVARKVPLDRTMVETDSPYLAPVPHRGKRNEPAFVLQVAEAMADLHDVSAAAVVEATAATARRLFFDDSSR